VQSKGEKERKIFICGVETGKMKAHIEPFGIHRAANRKRLGPGSPQVHGGMQKASGYARGDERLQKIWEERKEEGSPRPLTPRRGGIASAVAWISRPRKRKRNRLRLRQKRSCSEKTLTKVYLDQLPKKHGRNAV